MNSGTAPTGTETSCLIEPPSNFCKSEMNFAQTPKIVALREVGGERGVVDQAALQRLLEHGLESAFEPVPVCEAAFDQHVPGMRRLQGSRMSTPCASTKSSAMREISSKLTTSCPSRSRARRNRLSAAFGVGEPEERGDARARPRIEF